MEKFRYFGVEGWDGIGIGRDDGSYSSSGIGRKDGFCVDVILRFLRLFMFRVIFGVFVSIVILGLMYLDRYCGYLGSKLLLINYFKIRMCIWVL